MTKASQALAGAAGLATAGTVLGAGTGTAVVVLAGTALLVAGVGREWETGLNTGGAALLAALLLAGVQGVAPQLLVLGTVGGVVAWDAAVDGLGLARQLDARAQSRRAEVVRTGATLVVAAGAAAVATLAYFAGRGLVPAAAVIPVAAGALLVAAGLSPRTG